MKNVAPKDMSERRRMKTYASVHELMGVEDLVAANVNMGCEVELPDCTDIMAGVCTENTGLWLFSGSNVTVTLRAIKKFEDMKPCMILH